MCLAAIALHFAFPHQSYILHENYLPTISGQQDSNGRIVTMQSISNNLKETMNPKDIMHGKAHRGIQMIFLQWLILDAIHNFHPQYRDYTQYNAQVRKNFDQRRHKSISQASQLDTELPSVIVQLPPRVYLRLHLVLALTSSSSSSHTNAFFQ